MRQLSPQGQQVVNDFSQRHGFSQDAVTHMMFAVLNGNGTQTEKDSMLARKFCGF